MAELEKSLHILASTQKPLAPEDIPVNVESIVRKNAHFPEGKYPRKFDPQKDENQKQLLINLQKASILNRIRFISEDEARSRIGDISNLQHDETYSAVIDPVIEEMNQTVTKEIQSSLGLPSVYHSNAARQSQRDQEGQEEKERLKREVKAAKESVYQHMTLVKSNFFTPRVFPSNADIQISHRQEQQHVSLASEISQDFKSGLNLQPLMNKEETKWLEAEEERKKALKKAKKLEKLDYQLAPLQTTRNLQMGQTAQKSTFDQTKETKGILKANQTTLTGANMTQARTTASGAFFGARSKSTAIGETAQTTHGGDQGGPPAGSVVHPRSRVGMRTQHNWITFADQTQAEAEIEREKNDERANMDMELDPGSVTNIDMASQTVERRPYAINEEEETRSRHVGTAGATSRQLSSRQSAIDSLPPRDGTPLGQQGDQIVEAVRQVTVKTPLQKLVKQQNLETKRRSLLPEDYLPPILFPTQKDQIYKPSEEQDNFFQSFFEQGRDDQAALKAGQSVPGTFQEEISKKLMVQSKQIKSMQDPQGFIQAGFRKEHNIDVIQEFGTEREKRDLNDEDAGSFSDSDLNEFWETQEREINIKEKLSGGFVDEAKKQAKNAAQEKLENYLKVMSVYLTPKVHEYLIKRENGTMNDEEMMSQLGIIAFERRKFVESIKTIEKAFKQRLKDFNKVAKHQASFGMKLISQQCNTIFQTEWQQIVSQYNTMRNHLDTAEYRLLKSETQKHFLECENLAQKTYNSQPKDLKLTWIENEFEKGSPEDLKAEDGATDEAMNVANSVLDRPFQFYGGYLQLSLFKKPEIMRNETIRKLLRFIKQLQEEKLEMVTEREMIQNVATMNFDLAQQDADKIKEQHEIIKQLKKEAAVTKKLYRSEKMQIHKEGKEKLQQVTREYMQFKQVSKAEHQIQEEIIKKQASMLKDLKAELRSVKTMLEIPKFRDQLPRATMQGTTFKQFGRMMDDIFTDTKEQIDKYTKIKNPLNFAPDQITMTPQNLNYPSQNLPQENQSLKKQTRLNKNVSPSATLTGFNKSSIGGRSPDLSHILDETQYSSMQTSHQGIMLTNTISQSIQQELAHQKVSKNPSIFHGHSQMISGATHTNSIDQHQNIATTTTNHQQSSGLAENVTNSNKIQEINHNESSVPKEIDGQMVGQNTTTQLSNPRYPLGAVSSVQQFHKTSMMQLKTHQNLNMRSGNMVPVTGLKEAKNRRDVTPRKHGEGNRPKNGHFLNAIADDSESTLGGSPESRLFMASKIIEDEQIRLSKAEKNGQMQVQEHQEFAKKKRNGKFYHTFGGRNRQNNHKNTSTHNVNEQQQSYLEREASNDKKYQVSIKHQSSTHSTKSPFLSTNQEQPNQFVQQAIPNADLHIDTSVPNNLNFNSTQVGFSNSKLSGVFVQDSSSPTPISPLQPWTPFTPSLEMDNHRQGSKTSRNKRNPYTTYPSPNQNQNQNPQAKIATHIVRESIKRGDQRAREATKDQMRKFSLQPKEIKEGVSGEAGDYQEQRQRNERSLGPQGTTKQRSFAKRNQSLGGNKQQKLL